MTKILVLFFLFFALVQANPNDHWAVIVVGSKGYGNYRHSADGCHAYHAALRRGIPPSQIIFIAYGIDKIAHSLWNPFKGKLFNRPGGQDVFEGCAVDYKGQLATKDTVLGVLRGDASVGPKVLKSNQHSKVFFFFTDHGAPGLLCMSAGHSFFNTTDRMLYADELHDTIQYMHQHNMYQEMLIYVGACESGSMFEDILQDDIGVLAVTSTNSHEPGWGTYCPPDDIVNGTSVGACLGDLFAVNWMEHSDRVDLNTTTLEMQLEIVRQETNKSHVQSWGQASILREPIAEFQASGSDVTPGQSPRYNSIMQASRKNRHAVSSRDMDLLFRTTMAERYPSEANQRKLQRAIRQRRRVDAIFAGLSSAPKTTRIHFDCYRDLIGHYEASCGPLPSYAFQYFHIFVSACGGPPESVPRTKAHLTEVCSTGSSVSA